MAARPRYSRVLLAACLVAASSLPGARGAAADGAARSQPGARAGALVFDLPVPGGLDAFFSALRIATPPRSVALLSVIRLLYARAAPAAMAKHVSNAVEAQLGPAAASPPSPDTVPLPLSPDVWTKTIFKGNVTADRLLYAILRDRRASLLYYGLASVDDATLEYFDAHRPLLRQIYDQGVGAFATCARSVHLKDGAVVLPGGESAVAAWEEIVGEHAAAPDRFVLALVGGDEGRRAYFLDVVTHLDPARQAFALAAAYPPDRRRGLVRSLYGTVVEFEPRLWRVDAWPFARQQFDPAIVLMQVEALPDGRMKAPSGLAFWRAALDANEGACAKLNPEDAATPTDAAWLVARLMREPLADRQRLLSAVLFAQRVFSSTPISEARLACKVVARFRHFNGLMITLERLGVSSPNDYVGALQLASALSSQPDQRASILGVSQMQGMLALLGRLAATSPTNRHVARELAQSLFAPSTTAEPGTVPAAETLGQRVLLDTAASLSLDRLARWMREALLFRLCNANDSADACLEEAATGARLSGESRTTIEWEGARYRVDPPAAASMRLAQVRERQAAVRFDSALQLLAVGTALRDEPFAKATATEQAAFLRDLAGRLDVSAPMVAGGTLGSIASQLEETARQLASARQKPPLAAADVLDASHALLADAWTSFAYAMAIGDLDSSFLLAGDPARHHDFGLRGTTPSDPATPWQLAHEERRPSGGWQVRGSLLGLEQACALSWPRRLSSEPVVVTLTEPDERGFAQSVAALNGFALTDAGRTSIAAAIGRGTEFLNAVVRAPEVFAARAAAAGVSEWRVRGAIWTARHDPKAVRDLFALVELMWLGSPDAPAEQLDAWGVPSGPLDGSLGLRMPRGHAWEDVGGRGPGSLCSYVADLHLRVALWLDEMKLPSELMPAIVAFATWELITTAQPVDMDDYLAVARAAQAIPGDRLMDHLSALTTDATLTPVPKL